MSILVRHAMTEAPETASPETSAADAAELMQTLDVGVIPVVRDGELLGLVTDRDLALRVVAGRLHPDEVRLEEILTDAPVTVSPDTSLSEARELMAEQRIRRLPVVMDGELVGILSFGDIAIADASKRAVGEALEQVSESPSTVTLSEEPESGTPQRVLQARGDGA